MVWEQSVVDRLHVDFKQIVEHLGATEISLQTSAEEIFRKNLLLAAASYFERRISEGLLDFIGRTGSPDLVVEFVRKQAIERRYHTLFDWDRPNANKFFRLFGTPFGEYMEQYINDHPDFGESVRAFMEIGSERNRIVHQDFGSAPLEKTTDDIYRLYLRALLFVEQMPLRLDEHIQNGKGTEQ